MNSGKPTFARCPFCGGTEFRVTTREMLEELYTRKGAGAMSVACKRKGCGATMYQQQKELSDRDSLDYDYRLNLLAEKWNARAV